MLLLFLVESLPINTIVSNKQTGGSNFNVTLGHSTENATLLAANNIAVGDILTFSAPRDWIIEYSNLKGILSKEIQATRTATKNGAITDSVTLVVDGNSGTIAVGDVITGEGIVGLVSVITVTDQNNLVMSSTQTIANDIALTFTKFEPQTYTITGTLNVLRFGISNLTSQIGTNSILSSVATGAVSSDTASDPTLTLLGLYTGSHSGGNTRIKKIIEVWNS